MGKHCILRCQRLNYRFSFSTINIKKKNLHSSGCKGVCTVLITLKAAGFSPAEFFVGKTIHLNKSCPPRNKQFCFLLSENVTILVLSVFARIASVISPAEAYLCAILGISLR